MIRVDWPLSIMAFGLCVGHLSALLTINVYTDIYTPMSDDKDFLELLGEYTKPPADPNPKMLGFELNWVRGNPKYGSLHMQQKHNVTEQEVYEVLFLIPPYVEARGHPHEAGRTIFWGATQNDRWLIVICEAQTEQRRRVLTPVTAFTPDHEEEYWRSLQ